MGLPPAVAYDHRPLVKLSAEKGLPAQIGQLSGTLENGYHGQLACNISSENHVKTWCQTKQQVKLNMQQMAQVFEASMYNGQNMEHATQAFKALRRHSRQTYRHAKGTEMTWWMVPNHQINAKIQDMVNTHSNMMLPQEAKMGPFQGQQGEGVALPFWRLQGTIFTTEIPQDFSGEEAQTPKSRNLHKIAQNEAFQGLRGKYNARLGNKEAKLLPLKTPLTMNSKVITMMGVNVKAQRRPIFDKAEDLDKHARQTRKDVRELCNSRCFSLGGYNTCAARLVAPTSNEPYIQYRACKENKLNRYNAY
ncbi:hypothetical protein HYC85_028660 [Camellia sinensis]|uniref:Uncharacterized protein n=1 Tax=Camellia sinensis TaxID=4442 RepID=A0A7J7FW09_CAMSI|nr:hypothetical protein HYC85_028660 [Camellia sinensis]